MIWKWWNYKYYIFFLVPQLRQYMDPAYTDELILSDEAKSEIVLAGERICFGSTVCYSQIQRASLMTFIAVLFVSSLKCYLKWKKWSYNLHHHINKTVDNVLCVCVGGGSVMVENDAKICCFFDPYLIWQKCNFHPWAYWRLCLVCICSLACLFFSL